MADRDPQPKSERLFVGMMSGTSCDGVDAALIAVEGRGRTLTFKRLLGTATLSFSGQVRQRLLSVMSPATTTVDELLELSGEVCTCYQRCLGRLLINHRDVAGILSGVGVHGQTICHRPPMRRCECGLSWQLGQFARLAASLPCPVICDFRAADLAAGGQGAPLVPWTDWVLGRSTHETRVFVNLGGICNVTILRAQASVDQVQAGDIGPCNLLLDPLAASATDGRSAYDRGGKMALGGVVEPRLLDAWLAVTSMHAGSAAAGKRARLGAKSLGREQFGTAYVKDMIETADRLGTTSGQTCWPDRLATACALVGRQIAMTLQTQSASAASISASLSGDGVTRLVLCGGGTQNAALRRAIAEQNADAIVDTTDQLLGIPVQAKESVSFALLAAAHIDGVPANLPQVTGATRAAVLGVSIPGQLPQGQID